MTSIPQGSGPLGPQTPDYFKKGHKTKNPFEKKVAKLVYESLQKKYTTNKFQNKLSALFKKDTTVKTSSEDKEIYDQAMKVFNSLQGKTFEESHTITFDKLTKKLEQNLASSSDSEKTNREIIIKEI